MNDEMASLVETKESRERRNASGEANKPMTEAEQRNLKIVAENEQKKP